MKNYSYLLLLVAALFFSACSKNDNNDDTGPVVTSNVVEVSGDISASTT